VAGKLLEPSPCAAPVGRLVRWVGREEGREAGRQGGCLRTGVGGGAAGAKCKERSQRT